MKRKKRDGRSGTKKIKLSIPPEIANMFAKPDDKKSDASHHQGRIRSFDHVEGNWPTFVFLPVLQVSRGAAMSELVAEAMVKTRASFPNSTWSQFASDAMHLSLSKTFPLRLHQIDPFIDILSQYRGSEIDLKLANVSIFVNEEKTRSFAALCLISDGIETAMSALIAHVDSAVTAFGGSAYYKNPVFHVAFAWTLGDVLNKINSVSGGREEKDVLIPPSGSTPTALEQMDTKAQPSGDTPSFSTSMFSVIHAKYFLVKAGNKSFRIVLATA